jgi:enamine deaminase RidA (YjgF/YER057c/UK114 family)
MLPGRTSQAPISDAILADDTFYLFGRLGMDPGTGRPPVESEKEARNVLHQIRSVLEEADRTMDDLVNV